MERRLFNELSQFCFTYQEDEDIWFVGEKYSLIFQAGISDCTIKRVIRMKDAEWIQSRQYWKLVKVENKIVILPCDHSKIVIFNIESNRFSTIYLSEKTSPSMSYIQEGQSLYLINNSVIIILDVKSETVEEYIPIPYEADLINVMALKMEGHILIPLVYRNEILDFRISDRQFTRLHIDCDANGFAAGILDGTDVWLAGCNGNIVRWNYINRKSTLYNKFPDDFGSFDYDNDGKFMLWEKGWGHGVCFKYWYACFLIDDKIWFLPSLSDSLLYIDKKTNIIHKYPFKNEDETEFTMKNHRCQKFLFIGIQKERYIKIYSVKRDIIYSIDTVTLDYVEEIFDFDKVDMMSVEKEFSDDLCKKASEDCILENRNISIKELLAVIDKNKFGIDTDVSNDMNVGTHIYQCVAMINS